MAQLTLELTEKNKAATVSYNSRDRDYLFPPMLMRVTLGEESIVLPASIFMKLCQDVMLKLKGRD